MEIVTIANAVNQFGIMSLFDADRFSYMEPDGHEMPFMQAPCDDDDDDDDDDDGGGGPPYEGDDDDDDYGGDDDDDNC